ncbi:hypothetical protein LCGC14_0016830 [marine sediment metagenome]|uniref:Uncharacterized protein n=1 Tax=marine sediment metagenome TaxID=412755 RepID=A0A0F9YG77_9ZZZZ
MNRQIQTALILALIFMMLGCEKHQEESAITASAEETPKSLSSERSADLLKTEWKGRQLIEASSGATHASGDPVWSADGRRVAFELPRTGFRKGGRPGWTMGILDISTGECLTIPLLRRPVAWRPDGKGLLAIGPGGLWGVGPNSAHRAELLAAGVFPVKLSPGGNFLLCRAITTDKGSRWMVLDRDGNSLAEVDLSEVSTSVWSKDGRQLFCGGKGIRRIDLPSGEVEELFTVEDCPKSAFPEATLPPAASPPGMGAGAPALPSWRLTPLVALEDGRLVAKITYGQTGEVFVWRRTDDGDDFESLGKIWWRGDSCVGDVESSSSFVPIGRSGLLLHWKIAAQKDRKELNGSVVMLDTATGKRLDLNLPLELYAKRSVLSPDGRSAAFVLGSDLIELDTVTGKSRTVRLPVNAMRVSFSPNGDLLAINGYLSIRGLDNGNNMPDRTGSFWLFNRQGEGVAYLPISGEPAQTTEPPVDVEVGLLVEEAQDALAAVTSNRTETEDAGARRKRLQWTSICMLYCAQRLQELGKADEADSIRKQVDGFLNKDSRAAIIEHLVKSGQWSMAYIKTHLSAEGSFHVERNLVHNRHVVRWNVEALELFDAHAEAGPLRDMISEAEIPIKAMVEALANERDRKIKDAYDRMLHQAK